MAGQEACSGLTSTRAKSQREGGQCPFQSWQATRLRSTSRFTPEFLSTANGVRPVFRVLWVFLDALGFVRQGLVGSTSAVNVAGNCVTLPFHGRNVDRVRTLCSIANYNNNCLEAFCIQTRNPQFANVLMALQVGPGVLPHHLEALAAGWVKKQCVIDR